MKERIKGFIQTDFFISSLYSALAALIKIATVFLMSKIIAIYLGKEGMGLLGQLTNFVAITLVIAGGSINTGIVKYVAEFATNSKDKLQKMLSTAWWCTLILGSISGIVLILCAKLIAQQVLLNVKYQPVFILFGCTILFYSLNAFFLAVVNGFKKFKIFNILNIISSIGMLIISCLFIQWNNALGALYAIVTNQSLVFIFTLFYIIKYKIIRLADLQYGFHISSVKLLLRFVIMTLVSAACMPVCQILIRKQVMQQISLSAAGLWESINRISSVHLLFITTTLGTYYLPRLSEIQEAAVIKYEIRRTLKFALVGVLISSLIIILLRHFIIQVLFSSAFIEASNLLVWQTIGDVFKVISWIIAYQMQAKAMLKWFVVTEVSSTILYYLLSTLLLNHYGISGLTVSYAINYCIYLLGMFFLFRKTLF